MDSLRIGIMGGTFDPIHLGHLAIAEAAREEFSLAKVLFIPAAVPPHKQDRHIASAKRRLYMVKLAIAANPYFELDDRELNRVGPSYTADTLRELKHDVDCAADFYFITGTDAANDLATWYHPQEILANCHIIVTSRRGANLDMQNLAATLGEIVYKKIHRQITPLLDISSTDIRERLAKGHSIRYLVPEAVRQYIYEEGLYK